VRVTFNGFFNDGLASITEAANQRNTAALQVSTGKRINVPSDDPAAASSALGERARLDRIDSYTQAGNAVNARFTVVDSVLSDVLNQLTAAQTAGVSAQGSTVTQGQRNAAIQQLNAIRDSLVSDFNTQFQGTYLFSGTQSKTAPYSQGAGGAVSAYQGNSTVASVNIDDTRSVSLTFNAQQILQGPDAKDVFGSLNDLTTAIATNDNAGISTALGALNRVFGRVTLAQTTVGTSMNAVDASAQQLQAAKSAATSRLSSLEDADMAAAISQMSQADTAYRAALSAMANAGKLSLMDYLQ